MRRASILLLAACAACAPPPPRAAAPARAACAADFDSTVALVSRDYAGFAAGGPGATLTDSVRAAAAAEPGERECTRAILRWIDAFADPHLTVYGRAGAGIPRPEGRERRGGRALSLRFPGDGAAILRLPTFDLARRAAIDSLLALHHERLVATPVLIVDVRGNGGGWSGSYRGVLALLYTGPIRVRGIEIRASEGNLAAMRSDLAGAPAEVAAQIREVLPRMEAGVGGFVTLQEHAELRLDGVHPLPRAVGVLIDRGCASACEQFVLEARQSAKVTVFGAENTRGALDYLNVRTVPLPSGARTLRLPISRLGGLPAEAVNPAGLAPDALVPPGEDPLGFALRSLRGDATGTSPSASPPAGTAR